MGLKYILLSVLILAAIFTTIEGRRGRRPGWWSRPRRPTCEWCFTSSACFQGAAIEGVNGNCTDCIAEHCNEPFSLTNPYNSHGHEDWLECFEEEWQGEACSSANCPTWEFDDRVEECEDCLEDCRSLQLKVGREEHCSSNSDDACSTCIGGTDCFEEDEVEKIFSSFCLEYVYLKCKDEDLDADCVLEAIQSSCSECNASSTTLDRLNNCNGCLEDCSEENECRQQCRNNYPTTLNCPYCTFFCDENNDSPSKVCDDGEQCDNACDTCSDCLQECDALASQEFDFSDDCTCIEKKKKMPSLYGLLKKRRRNPYFNSWH